MIKIVVTEDKEHAAFIIEGLKEKADIVRVCWRKMKTPSADVRSSERCRLLALAYAVYLRKL